MAHVPDAELRAIVEPWLARLRQRIDEIGPPENLPEQARVSADLLRQLVQFAAGCMDDDPERAWHLLQAAQGEAANVKGIVEALPAMELRKRAADRSRSNAAKPRKPRRPEVTKQALLDFRDGFEKEHGIDRGWETAACAEFRISRATLKKKMV